MLEEIRAACIGSRMMSEDVFDLRLSQVIHAATIGGARALGRDDIGRIAPGAKADLVLVDVTHPAMRPVRDPLRSLVYQAAERAVRTVFVDGRRVVDGGRVLTLDLDAAAEALHEAQRRAEPRVAALDWAGRDHLAVSPLTFPDA
jgi:cytosine/adenosine deaminase-related metal-dependent hydrolase